MHITKKSSGNGDIYSVDAVYPNSRHDQLRMWEATNPEHIGIRASDSSPMVVSRSDVEEIFNAVLGPRETDADKKLAEVKALLDGLRARIGIGRFDIRDRVASGAAVRTLQDIERVFAPELPTEPGSIVKVRPKVSPGGLTYEMHRFCDGTWVGKSHHCQSDDILLSVFDVVEVL